MAAATKVSVDEYLLSSHEPECELVNGELFPKPMGTMKHQELEKKLLLILYGYEARGRGKAVQQLSIRHGDDVRNPDLVFIANDAQFENDILVTAPYLCNEVISPSQRPSELFAK